MSADGESRSTTWVGEEDVVVRVVKLVRENRRLRRVVALQALDQAALESVLRRVRKAGEAERAAPSPRRLKAQ